MAYSNWGAFVYRDGVRMKNREDVGVFDEEESGAPSGLRIWLNLLKHREEGGKTPEWRHSQHAVLGDGPVRLTGYKNDAGIWIAFDHEPRPLNPISWQTLSHVYEQMGDRGYDWDESAHGLIPAPVGDAVWEYRWTQFDNNMIDLELIEPNGTKWTSRCGFEYGAGWMD